MNMVDGIFFWSGLTLVVASFTPALYNSRKGFLCRVIGGFLAGYGMKGFF